MELLETPFRGTSWAVSDLPHSAWEDGAGTRLQSAKCQGGAGELQPVCAHSTL